MNDRFFVFTFENPAFSKLWGIACIQECARAASARVQVTSYCKYGYPYAKHTGILASFSTNLATKCSKIAPCRSIEKNGMHESSILNTTDKAARNSIPRALLLALLSGCVDHAHMMNAQGILVLDVFCGWGSLPNAFTSEITSKVDIPTFIYTNDIAKRRQCNMDVDVNSFGIDFLLVFAIRKYIEWRRSLGDYTLTTDELTVDTVDSYLHRHRLLVWSHISFPCTTYSTMGGGTHRSKGSLDPITPIASKHDHMLNSICKRCVELTNS